MACAWSQRKSVADSGIKISSFWNVSATTISTSLSPFLWYGHHINLSCFFLKVHLQQLDLSQRLKQKNTSDWRGVPEITITYTGQSHLVNLEKVKVYFNRIHFLFFLFLLKHYLSALYVKNNNNFGNVSLAKKQPCHTLLSLLCFRILTNQKHWIVLPNTNSQHNCTLF